MTVTEDTGALAPAAPRDNAGLLTMLDQIADEGWDGPAGRRLLTFVRERLARPLAVGAGLRGLSASQAEASAWQAAWEVLAFQDLRHTDKPWGVVWKAAQRAVTGEAVSARYGVDPWHSWRLARRGVPPLVGLEVLIELGLDAAREEHPATQLTLTDAYDVAVTALQEVGWPPPLAERIVATVADLPEPGTRRGWVSAGWRTMSGVLDLPPWQTRRLCVALLGTPSWPGLLARMLVDGPEARRVPAMQAALRCTRVRRLRSPVLAALRADDEFGSGRPQLAAS
jgi:hypothetical protein